MKQHFISVGVPPAPFAYDVLSRDDLTQEQKADPSFVPRYGPDVTSKATTKIYNSETAQIHQIARLKEVPLRLLASHPVVREADYPDLLYQYGSDQNIKDHLIERGKESVRRVLDLEVVKMLGDSVVSSQIIPTSRIGPANLNHARAILRDNNLPCGMILMNPLQFRHLEDLEWEAKTPAPGLKICDQDLNDPSRLVRGHYYDIPIYVSSIVPTRTTFVLAEKDYLGAIPVCDDCEVELADFDADSNDRKANWQLPAHHQNPSLWCGKAPVNQRPKWGWIVYSRIGIEVLRDYAIVAIKEAE